MQRILATTMIIIICFSMFSVFAPKVMAQQSIQTNFGSTLWISAGSGTFSSISKTSLTINVAPGQILSGSITLQANNNFPSDAIIPLIGTPSWGDQTTSWWLINSWLTTGTSYQTTNVNIVAPNSLGTYYLTFAFNGELNGAQVASATQWPVGHLVWNDGNDIAEFNSTQILQAQQNGAAENGKLTTNGYQSELVPSTAITIIVGSTSSLSPSPTPTASPTPSPILAPTPTPVSSPSPSPLVINIEPPSITQSGAPFTTTFIGVASGGTKPYSIVYTIKSTQGNSYLEVNPLTWTFKYAGTYYITAKVTDSKSNTATSPPITIQVLAASYLATFKVAYGTATLLFGTPSITLEQNGQQNKGTITTSSTTYNLETDVKINWGGVVLPDWANSFIGFSTPWYTLTANNGYSSSVAVPIQLSYDDKTSITANFQMGSPNVVNMVGLPYGTSMTYTFVASPTTPLAIALDLVSIACATAGVRLSQLIPNGPEWAVLYSIATYLASYFGDKLVSLSNPATSGLSASQTLQNLYGEIGDFIKNLYASIAGYLIGGGIDIFLAQLQKASLEEVSAASSYYAAAGDFVYDIMTLTASLIKGDLSDTYIVTEAAPMLSTIVDPNEILNVVLHTSQGDVGYADGVWENTGNLTGFVHSDVVNNTYGFAVPVSNQSYNANLAITSPNGESSLYDVVINWGDQTAKLTGTVNGHEQKSFPVTISGTALTVMSSQVNFPFLVTILVIGVIVVGVAGLFVVRKIRSKKRGDAVRGSGTEASVLSAQDTKVFRVEETPSAEASRVFSLAEVQRLERLKGMLDKGLITQEDYDNQKKKVLTSS